MPSSVSCLGVTVPCDMRRRLHSKTNKSDSDEVTTTTTTKTNGDSDERVSNEDVDECPSLENIERYKIQELVSDKDTEISDLEQFGIKQSIKGFKKSSHYWFVIRNDGEIRYMAPYADDVVDFFTEHYFIEDIGHSSCLPTDEYILSYNEENPGKVIKYAGTFNTDENGKIAFWSNDSGHYEPSADYAAPVAKAMGIEDAIFIPWTKDDEETSIFYRQYQDYTGPYSAKNKPSNLLDGITENVQEIFYPHNYHKWYRYHHGDILSKTHSSSHHNGLDKVAIFWLVMLMVALVFMGGLIAFFVKSAKTKRIMRKGKMDCSDDSDEEEEEEEDDHSDDNPDDNPDDV